MKKTWIIIALLLFLTGCVTVVEQSDEINDSSFHPYYELPLSGTSVKYGDKSDLLKEKLGSPVSVDIFDSYTVKYEYEDIYTAFGRTDSVTFILSEETEHDVDGSEYKFGIYEVRFILSECSMNEIEQELKTFYGPYFSKSEIVSSIAGIYADNEGLDYVGYKYVWDESMFAELSEKERLRADALLDALHEKGNYSAEKESVHLNDDSPLAFVNVEGFKEDSHLLVTFFAPLYCCLNIMAH